MKADCPELISVSMYVDGELPDQERSALLHHIENCSVCKEELETLNGLRATLGQMATDDAVKQRIFDSLVPVQSAGMLRRRISIPLPAAAAVLIALAASVVINGYLALPRAVGKQPSVETARPAQVALESTQSRMPARESANQAEEASPRSVTNVPGAGKAAKREASGATVITFRPD